MKLTATQRTYRLLVAARHLHLKLSREIPRTAEEQMPTTDLTTALQAVDVAQGALTAARLSIAAAVTVRTGERTRRTRHLAALAKAKR